MSRHAAGATIKLPIGQLSLIGLGFVAVTNPDKLFTLLHKSAQLLSSSFSSIDNNNNNNNGYSRSMTAPPPIVIHQTGGGPANPPPSRGTLGFLFQLVVGASFCWGSYVVMTNVLPEAAKGMLPVTTTAFNKAVSSLGKGLINLKDTLMEQFLGLSKKQHELGEKQDRTHKEVLIVKDNVGDLKGGLRVVQESLNLCHETLTESERRTAYIAQGVQLLTRGVSTFLPEDDPLLHDLINFSTTGERYNNPEQLNRLQQLLLSLQQNQDPGMQFAPLLPDRVGGSNDPENEVPGSPREEAERCLVEVRALLDSVNGTTTTSSSTRSSGGTTSRSNSAGNNSNNSKH